tara:strand:- start:18062 stop:18292 length:231 start_codon:yes stop_codon:yes gene_type:complete
MKLTVLIHNDDNPDEPIGMCVTSVQHLCNILSFQTEEKGMDVEGIVMIKPTEIDYDDDEIDESTEEIKEGSGIERG